MVGGSTAAATSGGAAPSARQLKEQGNKYFQTHRYDDAIQSYSKAIIKDPETATYFTNRALCHLHLKQWDKAQADCSKAVELDRKSVKAHYFLGRALTHLQHYDEAVVALTRALDLASSQKLHYGDELHAALRHVRAERFAKHEERRVQQEITLHTYLMKLIDEDEKCRQKELVAQCDEPPDKADSDAIGAQCEQAKLQLDAMFKQLDDRRRTREVPDYLCGRISFELMRDPVITPSGITYDRKDIVEHLHKVGHFDPVTRAALTVQQLVPNLAMKEVVDHFVSENEWVVDY